MKRKLSKKILSLLLALIMLFGPMINISYALENNGETLTPITTGELEVPITTIEESEKTIITTGEEYGILEESDTYLQFIPNESKSQEIVTSENFLEVSPVNEEKEIKKELAQPIEKKEDIINLENNVKENSDSKLKPQQTVPESVLSDNRIKNSKPSNEFQTEDVFLKNKIEIPDIMARNFQMNLLQMESGIFTYELIDGGVKITGFVSGMETVNLVIPDTINSQPVISIGDRAFFQKGIENLTLGNNVKVIEQYAFAANNISELTLPDSLETIGINSFRDNLLPSLDTKNVETIETSAFANNQLKDVIFGSIKNIGDTVFINNQLEKVSISESIESFGTSVFAYNDRYVLVETNSPIIVTEKTENGFGHVVNPVTITVRFLDEVSGEQLLNDQVFGNEFTDINGIIVLGEENTYTPPTISGYVPVSTPIVFVPDSVDYVLEVYYRNTSTIPRIELINTPRIEPDGDGSESVLLSFVKATDLNGNDISSNITVEPTSIDTSIPGNHKVTYTVTDELGNTGTRTVDIFVGTDWYDFPLGNGWVLGDFIYDGNKVLGFSDSGLAKVTTEKNLILPHINPADGVTIIDTVGVNHDPTTTSFRKRGLVSVSDFNDNIKVIEGSYGPYLADRIKGGFEGNAITEVNLINLEHAGAYSFYQNRLTSINFPKLKYIDSVTFTSNPITSINADDLPLVEYVGSSAFSGSKIVSLNMPSLKETGSAAFISNPISEGYFPSLVKIGPNTFASNKFTEMTKESFPVIEIIGSGAFRSNLITNIDLPTLIRIEDGAGSSNGAFVGNQITTIFPGGLQNLEYLGDYTFYNQNISNVPEDALSNLSEIGVSAFYGNNITEITLPIINNIEPGAFIGNPGLPEYDNLVVIWANSDNTHPNRENYIINPLNETVEGPFNEEDFIWDPNDYNRVLGFSTLGREKYEQLDEKEIHFPDRARTVGNYAFRSLQGL
ncbi:MAG: leucine-rich repeat protein, partial [Tissierellia bacterium]|nr:leucine-rich repeat protein [Tissierellia bacterium]